MPSPPSAPPLRGVRGGLLWLGGNYTHPMTLSLALACSTVAAAIIAAGVALCAAFGRCP